SRPATKAPRRAAARRISRPSPRSCSSGCKRTRRTSAGWQMAKGQVTSDDLSSGIKSFGGLSSLGGTSRAVRDNPFRDTRSEPVPQATIGHTPEPAPEGPRLGVVNGTDHASAPAEATLPVAAEPVREQRPVAPRETQRRAPVAPVVI